MASLAGQEMVLKQINKEESTDSKESKKEFSLLSICAVGIVTGNTWSALGSSIVVAIFNGGAPGIIFEFIAVSIFYGFVATSIAELASSIPSSAGIYHWASVTPGPRYGRIFGWFAGWWNTSAWICATASVSSIFGQMAVTLYSMYHPDYVMQRWHIVLGYQIATWLSVGFVLFADKVLPLISNIGLFSILIGVTTSVLVCLVMPTQTDTGFASSAFVWENWINNTGFESNTFVFLMGMINGAFAVGGVDVVSHIAEEIPDPKRNIPLAMAAAGVFGFITGLGYLITILYAISDIEAVLSTPYMPIMVIYLQATSSKLITVLLLMLIIIPGFCTSIGINITAGRSVWAMARDGAVPCSDYLGTISPRYKNPFNATLFCGYCTSILGVIYLVSNQAFNAFVGSFIVLSTLSYITAILPFTLTGRFSNTKKNNMVPGSFEMGPTIGYMVNIVSCLYMAVSIIIYCFPSTKTFTLSTMNYTSVIVGLVTLCATILWLIKGSTYIGPQGFEEAGLSPSSSIDEKELKN
ncbi:choline transport protein [Blumeria hordei DH14]|uniref:Choline transport protein n=1 Tax=Blumeria graminis f. sp. hordei (strain DH14) TaxID=546991 RepID=N1J515_BLUG1|nr:choline transport protein [Blumeria hordei DH14]